MAKSEDTTREGGTEVSRTEVLLPAPEIDTDTIRQTYEHVLSGAPSPVTDQRSLPDLLLGQMRLLADELALYMPHMRGEQQRIAEHVLAGARRLLADGTREAWDLAVQCRALLALCQHPGPLESAPAAGGQW